VLLAFFGESSMVLFCICLAVIGFAFGSIMGIYPGFTAQRFGRKYNSVNYGIMFIGFALAGLFGPTVITTIFQNAGRYQPAFLVSAVLAVVGEVLIVFLRRSLNKREA
jgi:MFS family permease